MANKLAGQRAKFSRARSLFYTSPEDTVRDRSIRQMAEVILSAPANGFTEDEVTQGEDVPDIVRQLSESGMAGSAAMDEPPDTLVASLKSVVFEDDLLSVGDGDQWVYAYGYRCAPDRLKVGSAMADPIARVAAQISTGTPDRPNIVLTIATHDCRALERALHGTLRLWGRQVSGAGAEWFIVTRDEIVHLYWTVATSP